MNGFSAIKKVRDEYIERLNGIYGNNLDKVREFANDFAFFHGRCVQIIS